jgi:AraC-like DNA-binding protein
VNVDVKRVPVRYLVMLRDLLQQRGADSAALLRMAQIEPSRFDDPTGHLLPAEMEAFLAAAHRLTGATDLGFELGRHVKMTSHDILGLGMLSCRNWDDVLKLVSRHYHLMTEAFTLRYERRGSRGEAIFTPTTAMPLQTLRFYCETHAVAHWNQIRLMLGRDAPACDTYLAMPTPPHVRRYDALAPARFHFDESALPGVRVVMGADLLDMPQPLADSRLRQQIDARCEALGSRPPTSEKNWGEYVTMMLREAQGTLVTLEDLARRANVSGRTIDRHLKKENLQFRDLSQQVRFERACELLREPNTTILTVALSLGFTEAGNFSRAFRRVVGMTPGEYQRRLAHGGADQAREAAAGAAQS